MYIIYIYIYYNIYIYILLFRLPRDCRACTIFAVVLGAACHSQEIVIGFYAREIINRLVILGLLSRLFVGRSFVGN